MKGDQIIVAQNNNENRIEVLTSKIKYNPLIIEDYNLSASDIWDISVIDNSKAAIITKKSYWFEVIMMFSEESKDSKIFPMEQITLIKYCHPTVIIIKECTELIQFSVNKEKMCYK